MKIDVVIVTLMVVLVVLHTGIGYFIWAKWRLRKMLKKAPPRPCAKIIKKYTGSCAWGELYFFECMYYAQPANRYGSWLGKLITEKVWVSEDEYNTYSTGSIITIMPTCWPSSTGKRGLVFKISPQPLDFNSFLKLRWEAEKILRAA